MRSHQDKHRRRRGLSLVEIMISLAISSMLLTAVAGAYSASSAVIEANDEFFRASQAARVSMNQILAELRKCSSATIDAAGDTISMTTASGDDRVYSYDAVAGELQMTTSKAAGSTFTLARQLQSFSLDTDADEDTISIVMCIQVGDNQTTLSGAATWRRAVAY